MATMNTAEKNLKVKENAVAAVTLPEGTVQVGDFTYAVPVVVEGENRFAEVTFTAKNNKDTKTTSAYNPEAKREEWLEDKEFKEEEAKRKAEAKARKSKSKSK